MKYAEAKTPDRYRFHNPPKPSPKAIKILARLLAESRARAEQYRCEDEAGESYTVPKWQLDNVSELPTTA